MRSTHPVRRGIALILSGQRRAILFGLLLSVLQSFAMLPVAWFVKRIFDVYLPARDETKLLLGGLAILLLLACILGAQLLGRYAITRPIKVGVNRLREDLLTKLQLLPQSYYDHHSKFRLHDTIMHDMERVDGMTVAVIGILLPAGIVALTLASVCAWLNWQLFAVIALVMPTMYFLARYSHRRQKQSIGAYRQDYAVSSRHLMTTLSHVELTRLHATEKLERKRQSRHFKRSRDSGLKMTLQYDIHLRVQQYALAVLTVVILIVGGISVASGRMSLGDLLSFYAVTSLLANALRESASALSQALLGYDSLLNVLKLVDLQPQPHYHGTQPLAFKGHLALRNVDFTYSQDSTNLLLSGVNLELRPGTITSLSGPNGSGKSSIIRLLLGLYRPLSGGVFADNIPFDEVDLTVLRRHIGIVMQDPVIFDGTISENITYGFPDAPEEAIIRASRISTAHEFITQLPDGYETKVGELGTLLSGGQRQRIAIARALIRQPALLIFDEPTNHLDNQATAQLLTRLRALTPAPAIFVVTHSLNVTHVADYTYQLEHGKLITIDVASPSTS